MEKRMYISARATAFERHAVRAYAMLQGKTVSDLIREMIIEKAVRPVREAMQAEVMQDVQE